VRSLAPLVCGWYEEESLCLTPVRIIRCRQNLDINNLSRSDIISKGKPFSQYQFSKKRIAQASAVRVVCVGIIRTSEFNLSVIVRIQSNPLSSGRNPLK
jgi:hypothetical protein